MTEPGNATRAFLGDEAQWSAVCLELNDVQGLWGGRTVRVEGNQQVTVQVVQPGRRENRYEFELEPGTWQRLLGLLMENDFLTIKPMDRSGIPDEARPTITVTNAVKDKWAVAKWAGVSDQRFDAIYSALSQLAARIRS